MGVCIVLLCGFSLLLLMHGTAVVVGTAINADLVSEQALKDTIPHVGDQESVREGMQYPQGTDQLLQAKRRMVFEIDKGTKLGDRKSLREEEEEEREGREERQVLVGRFPLPVSVKKLDNMNTTKQHNSDVLEESRCSSVHPNVLFLMRLPKSASTSFVDLLQGLSHHSNFEFYFHPSGAYNWNRLEMKRVAHFVGQRINRNPKSSGFVYARHLYFVNFTQYGLVNYTYMTVLRNPVDRFISSYLYYHFSSKKHIQAILDPEHRNESLEECLRLQHSGCAHNLMTKYFCGHESYCHKGSDEALQQAKRNLHQHFAAVGIMEEIEISLRVFKAILPRYFSSLKLENSGLRRLNKNEQSLSVSQELRETITQFNRADVQLYEHAKQLLHQRASRCAVG